MIHDPCHSEKKDWIRYLHIYLAKGTTGNTVTLNGAHEDDLGSEDGKDGLGVDEGGVAEVIKAARGEDLGAGLPPDGLAEGGAVLGEELGSEAAEGAEHGPPGVDDLDSEQTCRHLVHANPNSSYLTCNHCKIRMTHLKLTVLGEGLGVSGEAGGVPAVVTGVLAGQVGRWVAGQRAQVQGPVGTIPGIANTAIEASPAGGRGALAGHGDAGLAIANLHIDIDMTN
eukprot:SM000228S07373  [mRNA]  locus=s228:31896:32714:- [translate_table: standard]